MSEKHECGAECGCYELGGEVTRLAGKPNRSVVVSVRLSSDEFQALTQEAERLGLTTSALIRRRALLEVPNVTVSGARFYPATSNAAYTS